MVSAWRSVTKSCRADVVLGSVPAWGRSLKNRRRVAVGGGVVEGRRAAVAGAKGYIRGEDGVRGPSLGEKVKDLCK